MRYVYSALWLSATFVVRCYKHMCQSIIEDKLTNQWWQSLGWSFRGDATQSRISVVLSKPNQVVVLPKTNQVDVLPKPNQVVVLPKLNQIKLPPPPKKKK